MKYAPSETFFRLPSGQTVYKKPVTNLDIQDATVEEPSVF